MKKISKKQHEELVENVSSAKEELEELEAEFAKYDTIVDNCHNCKGTGQVEDGYGNLNHNIEGRMLYRDCNECKGKGYIK